MELESFAGKEVSEEIRLPALEAGIFRARFARALTADLSRLEGRFGAAPDALVGVEFLSGTVFAVDYVARTLRLGRQDAWPSAVGLDGRSPHPVVDVTIDGVRLRLKIDTGAEVIGVFDSAAPAWQGRVESEVDAADLSGAHGDDDTKTR